MQKNLILLSLFFIIGIVVGMFYPISHEILAYVGGTALALFALSLMLQANKQQFLPIFMIAAILAGWTNFSWRIDTTSPSHIIHFCDDRQWLDVTEVGGWIIKEPEVRQYKTNIVIKPEYVRIDEKGEKIPISKGHILLQLRPSMRRTYSKYQYGDYVITRKVSLIRPQPANNPGVFDYQRFLRNNNIYGMMNIRKDYQLHADTNKKFQNPIVDFALNLKKSLLWSIKKTMPYPESAFLGGVMLGLRQGLSKTVQNEFRAAGVAHVLAVSGLHVTIITALLFGLLSIVKVPKKFIAPPVIAGLIIFAIITGARPSTLRAVIMNSISLFSFCYLASNLKSSLLFGISVAALAILFFTPMILFEASFLYSFTAVLSLALLTAPILRFLTRYLTSLHSIILLVFTITLLGASIAYGVEIFHKPPMSLQILFILFLLSYFLRGFIPKSVRFSKLPYWLTSFTSAQLAIQLGLGPLNAYYFQKYSLAAPLANFIAIPLIGVNVQLGIISGILNFIPWVGNYLALIVNACNYLTVKLFLGSASYFARTIPYPEVTPPPQWFMLLYYSALLVIAYHYFIADKLRRVKVWIKPFFRNRELRFRFQIAALSLIVFFISGFSHFYVSREENLKITVYDLSVFGMGGGSSQLLELPGGKSLLIDGGVVGVKKRGRMLDWNMGSMAIGPVLRNKRIRTLEWVALTSPDVECSGGLPYILNSFYVNNFVDAFKINPESSQNLTLGLFLKLINDNYFSQKSDSAFVHETFQQYNQIIDAIHQHKTNQLVLHRGEKLLDQNYKGRKLIIEVLNPPLNRLSCYRTMTNNSLVFKVTYGKFSCLFPSLLTIDGQKSLLTLGDKLKADVMIAPFHGYKGSVYKSFLNKVAPKLIIVQTLPDRWKNRDVAKNVALYRKLGYKTLRTDEFGAVIITSSGNKNFDVKTMLKKPRYVEARKTKHYKKGKHRKYRKYKKYKHNT